MKATNRQSWMIWAIVVLAVMNISTLGTILVHQYQSKKEVTGSEQNQDQFEPGSAKFSGRYFRDRLHLNTMQMEQFREFNPVFRQKARAVNVALNNIRIQMLDEMSSSDADTVILNALSDSVGLLHRDLKKITYRYYLDMKSICNAEQQEQLEQLFGEMFTNDRIMGFPGKGGPGRRHGRGMN